MADYAVVRWANKSTGEIKEYPGFWIDDDGDRIRDSPLEMALRLVPDLVVAIEMAGFHAQTLAIAIAEVDR